jgi:glycosyltransferase involved in cell wall biosynthesis
MVTHSDYTRDARVTRYAEALADRGDDVHVLALKPSPELPRYEKAGSVTLVRIQPRFSKSELSRFSYIWPLVRFLAVTSVWIARHHARNPFDILHIHNIPDFLVLAGLYPKLKGARVILDIHDIVPEFYASKFSKSENSLGIRMLRWMEAASSRVADHVIIANHLWLEKYKRRTGANGKCSVFINNVDTNIFFTRPRTRHDGKLIVLFPGGLQWHQGVDIAIRAFKGVSARVANAEFHIYGDGNMKEALIRLTAELGLQEKVRFFNPLPVREIADVMANADLGVVPKRADGFGNEAYSTKIMEFLSLGIPVVVSSTRVDRFYFNEQVVRFFESGNEQALEESLIELLTDPAKRQSFSHRAKDYVAKEEWGIRKADYLDLVDRVAPVQRQHASSR